MSLDTTNTTATSLDVPAVITAGTSITGELDLGGLRLFGIEVGGTITAASLSFQVYSNVLAQWVDLYDGNTELTYTLGVNRAILIDYTKFASYQKIKIRSGVSASAVNQVAALTLGLSLRPV